jgi:hypothetical protein
MPQHSFDMLPRREGLRRLPSSSVWASRFAPEMNGLLFVPSDVCRFRKTCKRNNDKWMDLESLTKKGADPPQPGNSRRQHRTQPTSPGAG